MKRESIKKSLLFCLVFLATSCITINIYFPAAAVEKAADKIVEEVWGEKNKQKQEEQMQQDEQKKPEPQSLLRESLKLTLSVLGPRQAFAQEADINITTPAIRALKESIQNRADSIKPYMDSGQVGIANDGLLAVRNTDGLNLKDKAMLTRLIEKENKDRETLYIEITKANNFPPDRITDVKRIFARSWIKNAKKGWWIQDEEDKWKQK